MFNVSVIHGEVYMKSDNKLLLNKFKEYFFPYKILTFGLVVLILLGLIVGNISPYLYGLMLDSITVSNLKTLSILIMLYFIITIFTMFLSIIENYCGQMLCFKISNNIRKDMFRRVICMKSRYIDTYNSGEIISRINGDAESVVDFYVNIITNIIQILINLIVSIYFVIIISVKLSSVAIFYIPATFTVTFCARKVLKKLAERERELNDKYYSHLSETVNNLVGIKLFNLEKRNISKYDALISEKLKLTKKSIKVSATLQAANSIISLISSLYIIYLSAILINSNLLTIGSMVSFNTYINKLFSAVSNIWSINLSKQEAIVSINRIVKLTDSEIEEDINEIKINESVKRLHINDIDFSYNDDQSDILKGFSLDIFNNGFYSIVGENGCGKSTLAKLLTRLYEYNRGKIKINNTSIMDIEIKTLREMITYIPKDDFFITDSIYENIALGVDIPLDKVKDICMKIGIHQYIAELPEGYDTVVNEEGTLFSSGQKQKINVARAILRNSPIMIFDETTSNLDGKSEKEILYILKDMSKDHIIILISHRISSIMLSDKIFLMDRGKLSESGRHDELIEKSSLYYKLFKSLESLEENIK